MNFNDALPSSSTLKRIIEKLVKKTSSSSAKVKRESTKELYELAYRGARMPSEAIDAFIARLGDDDEETRESASWGLNYCSPFSIPSLVNCLGNNGAEVRRLAARALGNIGDEAQVAAPALRRLLTDADQSVRKDAAWALGLTHASDLSSIDALFALIESGTSHDLSAALHALGNIAKVLVDISLIQRRETTIFDALNHDDEDVRWSALFLIGSLKLEPVRRAAVLLALAKSDTSERVREAALSELKSHVGGAHSDEIEDSLAHIIRERTRLSRSACEVLAQLSTLNHCTIKALEDALVDDDVALPAAQALWKASGRFAESLPALARIFDDYDSSVCDFITELGCHALPLLPQVIKALESDDWDLQWAAADALGALASNDIDAIDSLRIGLSHDSPIVRSAVSRALAKVGAPAVPMLIGFVAEWTESRAAWGAFSLGEMGASAGEAIPVLKRGLASRLTPNSDACAIALAKVTGDASVVPTLIAILQTSDENRPRRAAVEALGALGPLALEAIHVLKTTVDDFDPEVAEAAIAAISQISPQRH